MHPFTLIHFIPFFPIIVCFFKYAIYIVCDYLNCNLLTMLYNSFIFCKFQLLSIKKELKKSLINAFKKSF